LKLVSERLYLQNTPETIFEELDVKDYEEIVICLQFTQVERAYYREHLSFIPRLTHENYKNRCYIKLRQLCCHPQVSKDWAEYLGTTIRSIEELRNSMITFKEKVIDQESRDLKNRKERIEKHQKELRLIPDNERKRTREQEDRKRELLKMIEQHTVKVSEIEALLTETRKQLVYFNNVVSTLEDSNAEKTCVICLEEVNYAAVTPCGHYFCDDCYKSFTRDQRTRCTMCRRPMAESSILYVQLNKEAKKPEDPNRYFNKGLISKYGTKPSALIEYINRTLREEPDSHFIVFSQWDDLLHMIGGILTENFIPNIFCEGNTYRKQNALDAFNSDKGDIKVIMLSLVNTACGTNLQRANHVILLDSIAGTREEVRAIETQAIGRCHRQGQKKAVKVIRFIMEDTIEEMVHNINIS